MNIFISLPLIAVLLFPCTAQDIREPPSVQVPPANSIPDEYVRKGGKFILPCEATGKPEPSYRWRLSGRDLDLNKLNIKQLSKGNIEISSFEPGDEGEYQCEASNKYGKSLSQVFNMRVADFIGTGKKEKKSFYGDVGKHLIITRTNSFISKPNPSYEWKTVADLDDPAPKQLVRNKRILQDLEGNLYFTSLQASDALEGGRFYKIDVFNSVVDQTLGGSYSSVQVDNGITPSDRTPNLIYPTTSVLKVDVLEGTEMKIQCIFGGHPEVDVTWSGPSKTLAITKEAGTQLFLREMTKEAAGEHECVGVNRAGNDRAKVTVEMHTIPKFTEGGKPTKQTLSEEETATFVCQTTADTNPQATVKWMINGVAVNEKMPGARTEVTTIENGKKMTIVGLRRDEDIKVVQCEAANKYKKLYIDAPLNVLMRTKIIDKPKSQVIQANATEVIFECTATSDPSTPPTQEWQRDGKPLSFYDDKRMVFNADTGSLTLNLDQLEGDQIAAYSGEYTCIASNGYSKDSSMATLEYNADSNTGELKSAAFPIWIILLIIAAVLLLLIFFLICCICIQRNKGDTYPVDAKERQHGNDPEADLDEMAFKDFIRKEPVEEKARKLSQASLTAADPMTMGSMDSLDQYGDWSEGKFSEDGSFIGEYQDRKKITVPSSKSSVA